MATNRPKIVIYSDNETIKKLDEVAKKKNRSRGNMAETIIKEWLEEHNDQSEQTGEIISMKPFA